MIIKVIQTSVICFGLLGSLIGCTPRGETKSLNEILEIAKNEFVQQASNAGAVQGEVTAIKGYLEVLVSDQSDGRAVAKAAADASTTLSGLITRAGYTSRPALTELVNQYREIVADAEAGEAQNSRLKLMATRTYTAIASELATTRFTVVPLAPDSKPAA